MRAAHRDALTAWRGLSIVEALLLFGLVAILLVQRSRRRWPFSVPSATALHGAHPACPEGASGGHGALAAVAEHTGHSMADAGMQHHGSEVADRAEVRFDPRREGWIGIRFASVERSTIQGFFRAVATVVPDESRVSEVHTRISGWIEALFVNTTGQRVRAGEPLAAIFSQELLASQSEYLSARRAAARLASVLGSSARDSLVESARSRLRVLGMTPAQIAELDRSDQPMRTVTVSAPRSGVVLHRGIAVGTAVDPSTEILTVVDLSVVWVLAEIPENQAPQVGVGTPALLRIPAARAEPIASRVTFLYPELSERTRTLRVRFVVPNRDERLRPGMYGVAELQGTSRVALTVPRDAVVDTGSEQHVFVVAAPDLLVPRRVVLGVRTGDRVEVSEGLQEGERIVASGVFLIDSESRLRASGVMGGHGGHGQ